MKVKPKLGLKNAADFLNRIRRKYQNSQEDIQLQHHNKTFIEEESLELYQQHSNIARSSRYQAVSKQQQKSQSQNINQSQTDKHSSFCDQLIRINLQSTLQTYQQDLQTLSQNRHFLEEQIEVLTEKIYKLSQMRKANDSLKEENNKNKEILINLIKEYQQSQQKLFNHRIAQQQAYNNLRSKIRRVLKDFPSDQRYNGFVQYWNQYIIKMIEQRKVVYFHAQCLSQRKDNQIINVATTNQNLQTGKDVENNLDEFEEKPKKKLSQKQKAALLGDLKSFAKNFKMPG